YRRILLTQRLQPFAELRRKPFVVEGEPTLINDEQRRAAIKPCLDAVEQIGQDGRCGPRPDQALGFEDLDRSSAELLDLGIEQPSVGTPKAIWPERALQCSRLQEDGKAGQCALGDGRRGE